MRRRLFRSLLVALIPLGGCAMGESGATPPPSVGTTVAQTTTSVDPTAMTTLPESTSPESTTETSISAPPLVSFEDVAGTYRAKDPGSEVLLQVLEDGTLRWGPQSQQIVLNARFDGSNVLITDPDCGEGLEGVYEMHVVESGDLALVLIEDECPGRAGNIPGEYTPTK